MANYEEFSIDIVRQWLRVDEMDWVERLLMAGSRLECVWRVVLLFVVCDSESASPGWIGHHHWVERVHSSLRLLHLVL
jgi:hypothetical protein